MTFLEASKIILEENLNRPMTTAEIWNSIIDKGLIKEFGKTPILTLNTILHRSDLFITIKDKPADKFIYKRYVSKNVKDSLIEAGFLTEEKLLQILRESKITL